MLFTKNNDWLITQMFSDVKGKIRFCYVLDVLDLNSGRIIVSDGLYFIHSVFVNDSYEKMVSGFSLQSLQLKGAVLQLRSFKFVHAMKNKVEMYIEDCVYMGEGSIKTNVSDISTYISKLTHDNNIKSNIKSNVAVKIDCKKDEEAAIIEKQKLIKEQFNEKQQQLIEKQFSEKQQLIKEQLITENQQLITKNQQELIKEQIIENKQQLILQLDKNEIHPNQSSGIASNNGVSVFSQKNKKKRPKELITESFIAVFSNDPAIPEAPQIEEYEMIDHNVNLSQYIRHSCSLPSSVIEKALFYGSSQSFKFSVPEISETEELEEKIKSQESSGRSVLSDISNRRALECCNFVNFQMGASFNIEDYLIKRYDDVSFDLIKYDSPSLDFKRKSTDSKTITRLRKFVLGSQESNDEKLVASTFVKKANRHFLRKPVIRVKSMFKNGLFRNMTVIESYLTLISFMKKSKKRGDSCNLDATKFKLSLFSTFNSHSSSNQLSAFSSNRLSNSVSLNQLSNSSSNQLSTSSLNQLSHSASSIDNKDVFSSINFQSSVGTKQHTSIESNFTIPSRLEHCTTDDELSLLDEFVDSSIFLDTIEISQISEQEFCPSSIDFSQQSIRSVDYINFIDTGFFSSDDSIDYPVFYDG